MPVSVSSRSSSPAHFSSSKRNKGNKRSYHPKSIKKVATSSLYEKIDEIYNKDQRDYSDIINPQEKNKIEQRKKALQEYENDGWVVVEKLKKFTQAIKKKEEETGGEYPLKEKETRLIQYLSDNMMVLKEKMQTCTQGDLLTEVDNYYVYTPLQYTSYQKTQICSLLDSIFPEQNNLS